MSKPLVAMEMVGNPRCWSLYVNRNPVVWNGKNLTYRGRRDFTENATIHYFKSKEDLEGVAHMIGRYHLKLGDMLFSYLEWR